VQHAYTLVLPSFLDIRDDSIHLDSEHGNKQVVQPDKKSMPKLQQMPTSTGRQPYRKSIGFEDESIST
jgi:hypothetical protein